MVALPAASAAPGGAAGALTRRWPLPCPVDLARTIGVHRRGRGDPTFQTDPAGAIWRTSLTPDGPGTPAVAARAGEARRPRTRSHDPCTKASGVPTSSQYPLSR